MTVDSSGIADLVWNHWQAGTLIEAKDAAGLPATRAEAYGAQARLEAKSALPRAGWKIAATSAAGQAHIGVDGPLAGRVLAETLHQDGAVISIATNQMRVAEPEFAFRFATAIPSRPQRYNVDEVLGLVSDLHLTIELPDSRFCDFANAGGACLIADNACARDLVVGHAVTADWRRIDLAEHPVHCEVEGRYTREGIGSNVLGDPREALAWCVNEVSGLGIDIQPGELITTGTSAVPLEIESGDAVTMDFGVLGKISVQIADAD